MYLEVTTKGHTIFVRLDEEDLAWARKWKWHWRKDRRRKKFYATRSTWVDGQRRTLYLHVEVHKLRRIRKPSALHYLVDHIDGDTLNCCRSNLRWATGSMNGKNRNGKAKKWYDARRSSEPLPAENGGALVEDGPQDRAPGSPITPSDVSPHTNPARPLDRRTE